MIFSTTDGLGARDRGESSRNIIIHIREQRQLSTSTTIGAERLGLGDGSLGRSAMDAIRGSRVCARPSSTRALVRPQSPISHGRVSGLTVGGSGRGLSARRRAANTERAAEQNEVLDQILKTIRSARAANTNPDYFELLGVEVGDDLKKIKKSYRARARVCHPDVAGEDGHEACIVLNEAYATLMDDDLREAYEFEQEEFDYYDDGNVFAKAMKETPYTGEPLSKQVPLDHFANRIEKDDLLKQGEQLAKAVFVDEISCIGCQYCVTCAAATFRNDEDTGRARVFGQWLSTEDEIQEAIDMCPVDCIHWVPKEQLAPLEYVMQHVLTVSMLSLFLFLSLSSFGISQLTARSPVLSCLSFSASLFRRRGLGSP